MLKVSVDTIASAIRQPQPINAAGVIAALRLAGIHVVGKTACLPDDPATVITSEFAQSAHEESLAAIRAFVRAEKAKNGGRIFSLAGVRMIRAG